MLCFGLKRVFAKAWTTSFSVAIVIILLITSFVGNREYRKVKEWWDWEEYVDHEPSLEAQDKVIVMGKLQRENTDWVARNLPNWQRAIYTVDNSSAPLHTPANKGKEAMAYLTYIIDHYARLPQIIVFLHSHRYSPPPIRHNDAWKYDNVRSIKALQLHYVLSNGYVNLRCVLDPGCTPSHLQNPHVTPEIWRQIFINSAYVPEKIGAACCAQFAISRRQVLARPLDEYLHFRQWILNSELDDEKSGRVFEYIWHIIFGKSPVYCPDLNVCYCKVFGQCE